MKHLLTALSKTANTYLFAVVSALAPSHTPAIAAPETNNTINLLCDSGTITIDLTAKTFEVDFLVNDVLPVKMTIKDGEVQKNGSASSVNITTNTITADHFPGPVNLFPQLGQFTPPPIHAYSIDRRSGMLTLMIVITPMRQMCIPLPNKQIF
jgi:hypothetical protein